MEAGGSVGDRGIPGQSEGYLLVLSSQPDFRVQRALVHCASKQLTALAGLSEQLQGGTVVPGEGLSLLRVPAVHLLNLMQHAADLHGGAHHHLESMVLSDPFGALGEGCEDLDGLRYLGAHFAFASFAAFQPSLNPL